jgi:hypothetical protein
MFNTVFTVFQSSIPLLFECHVTMNLRGLK